MKVGNRFAIPAHYGLSHDWAEMRLIGTYPACTLHAIIYRLLELHSDSTFKLKHPQAASEVLHRMIIDEDDLRYINTTPFYRMQKETYFEQIIGQFVADAMQEAYFDLQENIAFVEYWNIRVEVPQTNFSLCPNAEVEVGLYISENNVFVLYRDFTRDSFLELPCGHVGFKYDYFAAFQQAIGATAISESESQSYFLRCLDCNQEFPAKAIFQCAMETAQFITTRSQCSSLSQCTICSKSTQNLSGCSSNHRVCENCFLKNYLTDRYEYLPCCAELITREKWLDVTAKVASSRQLYFHLPNRSFECTVASVQAVQLELVVGQPEREMKETYSQPAEAPYEPPTEDKGEVDEPRSEHHLPNKCKTCSQGYTPIIKGWQCPNTCECKMCILAWAGGQEAATCKHCEVPYSPEIIDKMKSYKRCHVCQIALPKEQIISLKTCEVCKACIELPKGKSFELKCIGCQVPSKMTEENVKQVKAAQNTQVNACCILNILDIPFKKLSCNHLVCCRHMGVLKRCRKCGRDAEVVNDP